MAGRYWFQQRRLLDRRPLRTQEGRRFRWLTERGAGAHPAGEFAHRDDFRTTRHIRFRRQLREQDQFKFFGGFEHIRFQNPSDPVAGPFNGLGDYLFSTVSNTAFNNAKVLQVYLFGARYSFTQKFDLTGAWYHLDQNSYKGNGCSDNSASQCSGTENVYSIMGDYKFTKRWDAYAGVAFSKVSDGLASGFLHTSTADPMLGFRFRF